LRITGRQRLRTRREFFEELIGDLALDDDAPRIEADLTLMEKRPVRRGADGIVHVYIVKDDHWIVAAKLHGRTLERFARALRQHLRCFDAADQVDHAHVLAFEEDVGDFAGTTWRMRNDIDYAFREACFLGNLREDETSRERREFGRFHDDRVACRNRRENRAPGKNVGAVPWCEAGDDAERTSQTDGVNAGLVGFKDFAFGQIYPAGCPLDHFSDEVLLERGKGNGTTSFFSKRFCDFLAATLYDLSSLEK